MQHEEYARMREAEDHYWWFVARRQLAFRLLKRAKASGRLLDVGCGTGAFLQDATQFETHGLDASPEALRFATTRGLRNLVEGDAQALPYHDQEFDVVVSLDTLEHVPDDAAAAREIARILRPGGVFVLNVPAFRWLWGPHDVALMHHRRYRRSEVRKLLEGAGFQVEILSYSVFVLFGAVVLRRIIEKRQSGPARVTLPPVPEWVNRSLVGLMDLEGAMLEKIPLPWGSSVVSVARVPLDRKRLQDG